jgi:hypothetical protein
MKPVAIERSSRVFRVLLVAGALAGAGLAATGPAQAAGFVVVNGQLLSPAQIAMLEAMNCGPIADGYYRYNPSTRAWAFADDPWPRGYLGDNCSAPARRPSLSERRLLYRPGEILSGN